MLNKLTSSPSQTERTADGALLREKIPELRAAFAAVAGEESAALLETLLFDIVHRLTPATTSDDPPAKRVRLDAAGMPDATTTTDADPAHAPAAADAMEASPGPAPTATVSAVSKAASRPPPIAPLSVLLPQYESKEQRRAVHNFIKTQPGLPLLAAETEEVLAAAPAASAAKTANASAATAASVGSAATSTAPADAAPAVAGTATAAPVAAEAKPQIRIRYVGDAAGAHAVVVERSLWCWSSVRRVCILPTAPSWSLIGSVPQFRYMHNIMQRLTFD